MLAGHIFVILKCNITPFGCIALATLNGDDDDDAHDHVHDYAPRDSLFRDSVRLWTQVLMLHGLCYVQKVLL